MHCCQCWSSLRRTGLLLAGGLVVYGSGGHVFEVKAWCQSCLACSLVRHRKCQRSRGPVKHCILFQMCSAIFTWQIVIIRMPTSRGIISIYRPSLTCCAQILDVFHQGRAILFSSPPSIALHREDASTNASLRAPEDARGRHTRLRPRSKSQRNAYTIPSTDKASSWDDQWH